MDQWAGVVTSHREGTETDLIYGNYKLLLEICGHRVAHDRS